jgi:DNA-binding response OmpR family regulator
VTSPSRTVRLLHVEDNLTHRRLIAHLLAGSRDLVIDVYQADSEESAIRQLSEIGFDIILLDYHLSSGDGLNCLRRIRSIDPIVPIVALSGIATTDDAAELLEGGADDYLCKQDLTREILLRSIRSTLSRADLARHLPVIKDGDQHDRLRTLLGQLCSAFVDRLGPDWLRMLDDFETGARENHLSANDFKRLFDDVFSQIGDSHQRLNLETLVRPVMLEVLVRLYGQASAVAAAG